MGARKHIRANRIKEERKSTSLAVLRNCPTSPRKMRLLADQIRGVDVNKALDILKFSSKDSSVYMEKLLKSAIANWESKNEGQRLEESNVFVKQVFVDSARVLRRLLTAPQGRAYRIRKRSNHVTIILDSNNTDKE